MKFKKCRSCTFVKFYFLVVVATALTVRFFPEYTGVVATALMVGIPVFVLRKTPEELGFKNFSSGLKWGVFASLLILPLYALLCSQLVGFKGVELNEFLNFAVFYLAVAVSEEVFFRGYLYSEMDNEPFLPLISKANFVSSFLFGIAHVLIYYDPSMFKVFFPSLVMGWLYEKSGSIGAPVLFHFLSDLIHQFFPC